MNVEMETEMEMEMEMEMERRHLTRHQTRHLCLPWVTGRVIRRSDYSPHGWIEGTRPGPSESSTRAALVVLLAELREYRLGRRA